MTERVQVQDELEACSDMLFRRSKDRGIQAAGLIEGEWVSAAHPARTPEGALDALRVAIAKWTSPEARAKRAKDLASGRCV